MPAAHLPGQFAAFGCEDTKNRNHQRHSADCDGIGEIAPAIVALIAQGRGTRKLHSRGERDDSKKAYLTVSTDKRPHCVYATCGI